MIVEPTDMDLTWADIERDASKLPGMARSIWDPIGILMPDDAAQEIMLNHLDEILTLTADALEIPLAEVFAARHRIRWLQLAELGETPKRYAALDGGAPRLAG